MRVMEDGQQKGIELLSGSIPLLILVRLQKGKKTITAVSISVCFELHCSCFSDAQLGSELLVWQGFQRA